MKKLKKKIIIAMSGGVDSSVAAALLKRGGLVPEQAPEQQRRGKKKIYFLRPRYGVNFDVIGVFMKLADTPRFQKGMKRAKKVAKILNIPFYIFDLRKEFKKRIVDYFLKEYKKGNTPNPCVVCNKEIKFGLLLEKALALDGDFIATGHYVRKEKSGKVFRLKKGKDKTKDQSYFLWMLDQKQIERVLFPVGDYNKTEVKAMAKKFKLPVLGIPESQEICFIQTASPPVGGRGERRDFSLRPTVNDFLKEHLQPKAGPIVEQVHYGVKKIVGRHQGLWFYTIGQRKGIKLSEGPYYVLNKDQKKNLLIVTKREKDLYKKELVAKNVNWISGKIPETPLRVKAKIRYRHKPAFATITKRRSASQRGNTYLLRFEKPQRAITPGQSVVFYKGEELLGGGIIS